MAKVVKNNEVIIEDAINKLMAMFESGKMTEAISRTVIKKMGDDLPSDNWSLGNKLIMYGNETIDGRGFKQWETVGRKVKRGSKAFYILGPMIKKIEVEDKKTGDKETKNIITGFKTIPIFKAEDTEGDPIQYPDYKPKELPPLYDVAKALNIDVKYVPFVKSAYGSYNLVSKNINLHTYDVKTFFHELGHAVHNTFKTLKGGQQADQEIVAEMVSAVICQIYNVKGYEYNSYKYIENYSQDKTPKGVIKSIMQVFNDVEIVLEKVFKIADELKLQEAI